MLLAKRDTPFEDSSGFSENVFGTKETLNFEIRSTKFVLFSRRKPQTNTNDQDSKSFLKVYV